MVKESTAPNSPHPSSPMLRATHPDRNRGRGIEAQLGELASLEAAHQG